MLIGLYRTKAELLHSIGEPLHVQGENVFQDEGAGSRVVVIRGHDLEGEGRPWVAEVTVIHGRIVHVQ